MFEARILIADDYREGREALANQLRDQGFTVKTADRTTLTLENIRLFGPQVILLAMGRPVISALTIIAQIGELVPTCRVVSVAGSRDVSIARAAVDAGAMAYLPDPMQFSNLLVALRPLFSENSRRLTHSA